MKTNSVTTIMKLWNVVLLSALIIVLYSVINWLTPVWCDDLDYGAEGHTFSDIFHREYYDYFTANGRIFSHTLVQVFVGMLGKPLFNLVNPVMSLLMILLILVASGFNLNNIYDRWKSFFFISFSLLFVWFFLPDQYITMFMVAGSSNYIWAAVLNLSFVVVFKQVLVNDKELTTIQWIGIYILSFLAGTWMELYSIALMPALFCYLILNWGKWNKRVILPVCLYVIGAMIVILAPGNFVRQGGTLGSQVSIPTWLVNQLELAIRYNLIWIWLCTLVFLVIERINRQVKFKDFLTSNVIWIVAIIVSYAFLFVSGVVSWRSQWGIFIFSFVPFFWILDKLKINKYFCIVISIISVIAVCIDFSKEFQIVRTKNSAVLELLQQARSGTLVDGKYYLWPKTDESRKSIPVPTDLNGDWPGSYFRYLYHLEDFVIMPELAYDYCKGGETDYRMYFDVGPIVNDNVVIECDSSAQSIILEYGSETSEGFVLSSKFRRLISAFGCERYAHKVYCSKNDVVCGKVLLKTLDPSYLNVEVGAGIENVFLFDYEGKRFLVAPLEKIKPLYDVKLTSCKVL